MAEPRIKTVALDPATYDLLRQARREGESFNDAVRRLARPRQRLSEFAGIASHLSRRDQREADDGLQRGRAKEKLRLRQLAERAEA